MADGWARVSHTPGVATTTCGPGVSQLGTAFVTAARAESPLVAFCGEHPLSDDEYNQRFDNARFAAACEAGFVRLNSPEAADDVVRKAFYLAKLESRPIPGSPFQYRFYLDLEGHAVREPVRGALAEVEPLTVELRVLGSFPVAE